LDLQLVGCTQSGQAEAIEQYDQAIYCAGGSASMTATALALMMMINNVREDETATTTTTTTLVRPHRRRHDIYVVTKVGHDPNGDMLLDFYRQAGAKTDLCLRSKEIVGTSMAVLPIFQKGGGRGCYFNLGVNRTFSHYELLGQLDKLIQRDSTNKNKTTDIVVDAFLFGYPHLLPLLQGENLKSLLTCIRTKFDKKENTAVPPPPPLLIGVDLNGVNTENHTNAILGPALHQIDILHLNEDEATIILLASSAAATPATPPAAAAAAAASLKELLLVGFEATNEKLLQLVANQLHYPPPAQSDNNVIINDDGSDKCEEDKEEEGCAVVLLSMGSKGSYISVTSNIQRLQRCPPSIRNHWKPGTSLFCPAYAIESSSSSTTTTTTSTTTTEEEDNRNSSSSSSSSSSSVNKQVFLNTNGAGDALFAGFCWITATQETVTVEQAGMFASLVARQRCDTRTRDVPTHTVHDLWTMVQTGTNLPPALVS
jgi:sugar/nucleoside kinase (ribokinase family)